MNDNVNKPSTVQRLREIIKDKCAGVPFFNYEGETVLPVDAKRMSAILVEAYKMGLEDASNDFFVELDQLKKELFK